MYLNDAFEIASWVRGELEPACEQIVIAGSIRRRAPRPGDIEIVCIPKRPGPPVFGQGLPREPLELKLAELTRTEQFIALDKNGDRFKNFMVRHAVGSMKLDLFICRPPASWGWLLLLRTGPADFTHWLVTDVTDGGACPVNMMFEDGQLWRTSPGTQEWEPVYTPDEASVFAALGVTFRPPHQRLALWKGKARA